MTVENLGVFSSTSLSFISELGRRISVHTRDVRGSSISLFSWRLPYRPLSVAALKLLLLVFKPTSTKPQEEN